MKNTIVILLAFVTSGTALAQGAVESKLDELMTAYNAVDLFNGTVLVEQNGKIILNKAYGFSNKKTGRRNQIDTKYLIYSATKPFTATLILKLIDEKKLSLSDKLSKFYPAFPNSNDITIQHLLTHTSGIYNYNNDFTMPVSSEGAMIEYLEKKPLDFAPGSDWNYSNTGYFLLGYIAEKVLGMKYEAAARKYIFVPAKMMESGFNYKQLSDPKKAVGYSSIHRSSARESVLYNNNELFSAGGMYSTVGDLYKFHEALRSNKLISAELTNAAYAVYKGNYGFGWYIENISGHKMVSHPGGASGFRSYFIRAVDSDICIILLSNTENAEVAGIKKKILNILFNEPYTAPKQIFIQDSVLYAYEGAFGLNSEMTIYITFKNGRLTATPKQQSTSVLLPQTQNTFYVDEIDGLIEFKENAVTGSYDTLVLSQDGRKYSATRINASWGITGSATPNGWNGPDIILKPDSSRKNIWRADNVQLASGEIKFRFNNDWTYNFGSGNGDILKHDGANMKVIAGNYHILLDLSDPDNPRYSMKSVH